MTYINLDNLSRETLVAMVNDLNDRNADLERDAQRLAESLDHEVETSGALRQTQAHMQQQIYDLEDQCARLRYDGGRSEQDAKVEIGQKMLDQVMYLDDVSAAHVVCGLVSEVCGQKIRSIKALRGRTGMGLLETKNAVEGWRDEFANRVPF